MDGNYTFYVRGDDYVQLYLSANADPANLRLVAQCTSWSYSPFQYLGGNPGQVSAALPLLAGVPYFVRATHKEDQGLDWFDVGLRIAPSNSSAGFGSAAQLARRATPSFLKLQIATLVVRGVQVRQDGDRAEYALDTRGWELSLTPTHCRSRPSTSRGLLRGGGASLPPTSASSPSRPWPQRLKSQRHWTAS